MMPTWYVWCRSVQCVLPPTEGAMLRCIDRLKLSTRVLLHVLLVELDDRQIATRVMHRRVTTQRLRLWVVRVKVLHQRDTWSRHHRLGATRRETFLITRRWRAHRTRYI